MDVDNPIEAVVRHLEDHRQAGFEVHLREEADMVAQDEAIMKEKRGTRDTHNPGRHHPQGEGGDHILIRVHRLVRHQGDEELQ